MTKRLKRPRDFSQADKLVIDIRYRPGRGPATNAQRGNYSLFSLDWIFCCMIDAASSGSAAEAALS